MAEAQATTVEETEPAKAAPRPESEAATFLLDYDQEIARLVNEGTLRPGMMPMGFKA
jgi:hypothetical protein